MPKLPKEAVRDLLPSKSADSYEKVWEDLHEALGTRKPSEIRLIKYFKSEYDRGSVLPRSGCYLVK